MSVPAPLFALHGWALNAAVFGGLHRAFAPREVLAPDLPGHGSRRSEALGQDPAALVERLLEIAPARAVWLGWSLGGLLALEASRCAPDRVTGLVLVAGTASFLARPTWSEGMEGARLEAMRAELARDIGATVESFLALQVLNSSAGRATLRGLRAALAERGHAGPPALADGLALLAALDFSTTAGDIPAPALVVAGGRDRIVHPEASRELAARLPAGRFALIERAGHAPFLSHPERFHALVADFLRETDDGSG